MKPTTRAFLSTITLLVLCVPRIMAGTKVGFIYSDQILKEYEGARELGSLLNREKSTFKQQTDSIYALLAKARSELESQSLILSDQAKEAKTSEVAELQELYDKTVREIYSPGGKLEQRTKELMAPITERIRDAVAKIATDGGYALVFDAAELRTAIIYALPGSDLTAQVLEELKSELRPVAAEPQKRTRYAVCPIFESNEEAKQANLGDQCRILVFEALKNQSHAEMVTAAELNSALTNLGVTGKASFGTDVIYLAGRDVLADIICYGEVAKTGQRITITLTLADPRLSKSYPSESATTGRADDLRQVIGNLVQRLVRKLPQ